MASATLSLAATSDGSDSYLDDLPSQAWVLQIQEVPSRAYQHMKNILRYATATGVCSPEQLSDLLTMVDNFVVPVAEREDMAAAAFARSDTESSTSSGGAGSGDDSDDAGDTDLAIGRAPTRGERLNLLAQTMEHPLQGVKIGRHRLRMKTFSNVFTGADAVSWMLERGTVDTPDEAVKLGSQLLHHGHIVHVSGRKSFDSRANLFYRFSKHPSPLTLHVPSVVDAHCPSMRHSLLRLVYAVHDDDVPRWLATASPAHLRVAFPAVLLWARMNRDAAAVVTQRLGDMAKDDRSLKVALWSFHKANNFECMSEDCKRVAPLDQEKATVEMLDSGETPNAIAKRLEADGTVVQHPFVNRAARVKFVREFTSAAKPSWVSFHDPETDEHILPDAVAKIGDDTRKDLAVQLIFKAAESFWAAAPVVWRTGEAPTVNTFGVVATSDQAGFLEFVRNARTVKEVAEERDWKNVDLKRLAPSIVGTLMSGFVLGVRDRHSENQLLINNERYGALDYGYMLMEAPGGLALDTPRLTLQPQLIKLLKAAPGHDDKHSLLQDIQYDLITAYRVLRQHYPAFVSFCRVTLSNIYPESKITSFLWGTHCFRAGQSEAKAIKWIEGKVLGQLTETNLRRGAKHAIVKMYYGFKGL